MTSLCPFKLKITTLYLIKLFSMTHFIEYNVIVCINYSWFQISSFTLSWRVIIFEHIYKMKDMIKSKILWHFWISSKCFSWFFLPSVSECVAINIMHCHTSKLKSSFLYALSLFITYLFHFFLAISLLTLLYQWIEPNLRKKIWPSIKWKI
jgi:hypothetical protein